MRDHDLAVEPTGRQLPHRRSRRKAAGAWKGATVGAVPVNGAAKH